ncbi:MAG: hypothetical protein WAW92_01990 [Minisyncoccia bacterium]
MTNKHCERCDSHVLSAHTRDGDIVITISCPECGSVKSYSLDELIGDVSEDESVIPDSDFNIVITVPTSSLKN